MAKRNKRQQPSDPRPFLGSSASPIPTEDDEPPVIVVCQGRPICNYDGSGDTEAHMNACHFCTRITCHDDGSETVQEPARC